MQLFIRQLITTAVHDCRDALRIDTVMAHVCLAVPNTLHTYSRLVQNSRYHRAFLEFCAAVQTTIGQADVALGTAGCGFVVAAR